MPNIDKLVDGISQIIAERKAGNSYFTKLDFTYAYGQVSLEKETSEQCNFSLIGGKSTGTYRFKNGFYGLTSMPAEFQKVIDNLLKEFPQANAFIDYIFFASKGTKIEHIALVEKILKKRDVSNVALKLRKCEFAKTECEWLGYRIGESGIAPLVTKTQAVEDLKTPKSRKQLKSLMGSMHSLHKFLPNIAEVSAPLISLLSQNNDFVWTSGCEDAFQQLKLLVKKVVEIRHCDISRETRIICDASHDGLGAVLEQHSASVWHPISFASRYLKPAEKKYSSNELELLAVVWATEYFRNYIYGRYFTVISDHKALITLLNSSPKGNKTFFSRLTRWYDRLVPYDLKVENRQGSKMGMADYLSRFPSAEAPETSRYDESFIVAKKMISEALNPKAKMKPRGHNVRNIRSKPAVGGEQSCSAITKTVASNGNIRTTEFANTHCESKRYLEGVCMQPAVNQSESRDLHTGGNMQTSKKEIQTLFSIRNFKSRYPNNE